MHQPSVYTSRVTVKEQLLHKPTSMFTHNTSHGLYKRVVVVGRGCHIKTKFCVYITKQTADVSSAQCF